MNDDPEFVYVVVYTHRHGSDTRVYKTWESVKDYKDELGEAYWDKEIGGETPETDVGDRYFEIMGARDKEYFEVDQLRANE